MLLKFFGGVLYQYETRSNVLADDYAEGKVIGKAYQAAFLKLNEKISAVLVGKPE